MICFHLFVTQSYRMVCNIACITILLVSYGQGLLLPRTKVCSCRTSWGRVNDDNFYFWLRFKTKLLSRSAPINQEQSASNLVQKFLRSKSMRKWLKDPPCPRFPNYLLSHGRYEPEKWCVFVRHLTLPFVWDLWCKKEKRALACSFVWYWDGERSASGAGRTLTQEGFLLIWNCAPGKGQLWGEKMNRI